jgi:hypothetical protein
MEIEYVDPQLFDEFLGLPDGERGIVVMPCPGTTPTPGLGVLLSVNQLLDIG